MRIPTFIPLLAVFCLGCEEIIDLELDTAEPQLVIEAVVTDRYNPACRVDLSKTQPVFSSAPVERVSGALVIVSDETGVVDTLQEAPDIPGTYFSSVLVGVVGRAYQLQVVAEGRTYTAQTTLNRPFQLDSLGLRYRDDIPFQDAEWKPILYGRDPAGEGDGILVRFFRNDTLLTGEEYIYSLQDVLWDGQYLSFELPGGGFRTPGAKITVEVSSLNALQEAYYDNWEIILEGAGDPFSPPPWNPISNIQGGALGLFRASAVDTATVYVPQ